MIDSKRSESATFKKEKKVEKDVSPDYERVWQTTKGQEMARDSCLACEADENDSTMGLYFGKTFANDYVLDLCILSL